MDKIQIVSFLLTRRCDLKCEYCRISKDYNYPLEYKNLQYFNSKEITTKETLQTLSKLKLHNKDIFIILYGGEITIRKDLSEIIGHCHQENINYTIISNMTPRSKKVIDSLIQDHGYLQGLTSSIDPIDFEENNVNQFKKTQYGLEFIKYKDKVKDLVAEITVSNSNLQNLYPLVEKLTNLGINSDITFLDISKTNYYDFSNITDPKLLVNKDSKVKDILNNIIDSNLNVHMRDVLLLKIYDILPSELNCKIEEDIHNITIDSDGSIRLCLRIAGIQTPLKFNVLNFMDDNGNLNKDLKSSLAEDKKNLCKSCGWTCMIMSSLIAKYKGDISELLHTEIRK